MEKIILSNIEKNIPSSIKVNGKVWDDISISDMYIGGTLILRTESIKISHNENYFLIERELSKDNYIAMWSLYIVKHLTCSYVKTENAIYLEYAKETLQKYMNAVESSGVTKDKLLSYYFNTTIVIVYLCVLLSNKQDTFTEQIKGFLEKNYLTIDLSAKMYPTLKAQVCAAKLLVQIILEKNVQSEVLEAMLECTHEYLNADGTSVDGSISSNAYYNRFFSAFIEFLSLTEHTGEELKFKYKSQERFLCTMTGASMFYPALGRNMSTRSGYQPLNENGYFEDGHIYVHRNEDCFLLNKYYSSTDTISLSMFWECLGKAIFLEHATNGDDIVRTGFQYRKNNLEDGQADIIVKDFSVQLAENGKNCGVQVEYNCDESIQKISATCNWENVESEVSHYFVLSSGAKEICIKDKKVSFYSGGNLINIEVIGDEKVRINLSSGESHENGVAVQTKIVEIISNNMPGGGSGKLDISISIDGDVFKAYKSGREDFLTERAYRQVDSIVNSDIIASLISQGNIGATEIYRLGRQAYLEHDFETAKRCEILNSVLHNCIIKSTCKIGAGARLAYGGVGVLIHANSEIGKYSMIGVGSSLAAGVTLGDHVYVSPGVRFTDKFHVGNFCVIGANAVVLKEVEPFSVMAGVPAKVIGKITPENLEKYLLHYFCAVDKQNVEFVERVRKEFLEQYDAYMKR